MKKLASLTSGGLFLLSAVSVLAQEITINKPSQGYSDLGTFITNIVQLVFVFALIAVLVMMIWGAFEWIVSGGDKDAVAKARNRILNSLIGLAVLAVAFALFKFAGQFLGFGGNIGDNQIKLPIPTPK